MGQDSEGAKIQNTAAHEMDIVDWGTIIVATIANLNLDYAR